MKSTTTRRQKVTAESDPLSLFLSQSATEEHEEEEIVEKVLLQTQQTSSKGTAGLINSLAPEKPIEYEPPTPPTRETIKNSSPVEESIKVVMKKEENLTPIVTKQPVPSQPTQPIQTTQVLKQTKEIPVPVPAPPVPASVFEEEDDIFLKKVVKKSVEEDDIFGTKSGELSELKFIGSKEKLIPNKLQEYDSDEEEKVCPPHFIISTPSLNIL